MATKRWNAHLERLPGGNQVVLQFYLMTVRIPQVEWQRITDELFPQSEAPVSRWDVGQYADVQSLNWPRPCGRCGQWHTTDIARAACSRKEDL
jgi:hypothetical protein